MKKIVCIICIFTLLVCTVFATSVFASEDLVDSTATQYYIGSTTVELQGEAYYNSSTNNVRGRTTLEAISSVSGSVTSLIWSTATVGLTNGTTNTVYGPSKNVSLKYIYDYDYVDINVGTSSSTSYVTIYHYAQYGNVHGVQTNVGGSDLQSLEVSYFAGIDF